MADDKDVLGKADRLLRRHQAGVDTGGVPVLTERFETAPAAPPAARSVELTDEERELAERVRQAVEARLAHELERRVTRELSPRLDEAIARAVEELRGELSAAVAEAVTQALRSGPVK